MSFLTLENSGLTNPEYEIEKEFLILTLMLLLLENINVLDKMLTTLMLLLFITKC